MFSCYARAPVSYTHLDVYKRQTQASTKPPTFVAFVNRKDLFHFSYQRYLENQIRNTFNLEGTPIRFIIRERDRNDA